MSEVTSTSNNAPGGEAPKKKSKIKSFFSKLWKFIKKHKVLVIILLVIIIAGGYFLKNKLSQQDAALQEQPSTFTTELEKMDLQKSVSVTGTLAAGTTSSVTSTMATGTEIQAVNYEVGDYVEAGDVIVVFDGDDYQQALAKLNAKYNISDTENAHTLQEYLDQIEDYQDQIAEIQEYLDEYETIYNNLKDAYEDYQENPNYEEYATRYTRESSAAQSIYGVSIETYESKQDQLEELQDKITDTQYQYELAQLNQEYNNTYTKTEEYEQVTDNSTSVTAPISGYITSLNVEEGNNYTQGSTLFTIQDTSSFVVEATVDEYDIASLEKGQQCVVKFDATDDEEFTGELTYVAVSTSSSSSSTTSASASQSSSSGSYSIKITLDSTDERLRVGMTAKASVILESASDVYAVAYDCIEEDEDGNSYVTEVDDAGNETKITVTKGLESDYYVEISGDDLYEGMKLKATASSTSSSSDDYYMTFDMEGGDMGGAPGGGGDMGGGPGGGF